MKEGQYNQEIRNKETSIRSNDKRIEETVGKKRKSLKKVEKLVYIIKERTASFATRTTCGDGNVG